MFFISVLLVSSLHCIVNACIHTENLEHYLNDTEKYFINNSHLIIKPGKYFLKTELVIQHLSNFSLIGNSSCKITCGLHKSIRVFNVEGFRLENINFEYCNQNYSNYLHITFKYEYVFISKPSRNASILLYNCTSVTINNVSVSVNAGTTGILVVNVKGYSMLNNVSITINYTICPTKDEHQEQINGILLYYDYNWNNITTNMELDNFQFTAYGSCAHPLQYAITLLLFQKTTNVSFIVNNTDFSNLINASLLYYYGETCGNSASNNLMFTNCIISNNTGYFNFKMFEIILHNQGCFDNALIIHYCNQQYNNISFTNCKFAENHDISAMIHVTPASSRATTGYVSIQNSSFCNNYNTHFLIMESDTDSVWQLSNIISINATRILSNRHTEGRNLLSATNCWMKFIGTIVITNNSLYKNIMNLRLCGTSFQHNITITNNTARQVFYGSYILILENTTLDVSFNTVYMVVTQTLPTSVRLVCGVQFYSETGNLDKINNTEWSFKVISEYNTHMTSKSLPGNSLLYTNCRWLTGTAFHTKSSAEVFKQIFYVKNLVIGNVEKRPIPLSVCKCENSSTGVQPTVNCSLPYLGSIFPGETLTVQLLVQEQWISTRNSSRAIIVENSSDQDNCSIVHASELSQSHFSSINYCNNYSYTLWPKNETIKECQLFIGLKNMPEMFHVQIKTCPKGFTLQVHRKSCHCDPLLSNKPLSITSCNVKDETILRPANSWIFAETDSNTHTYQYKVSLHCPFDHCLPASSHINLSNPDSQCQFDRTDVLCGRCKPGLSVVLGSAECKSCSNVYLLLLIPVGVSGIALVVVLYVFNLTVRSGTINTFIFYVNIVNINILTLFPGCQSFFCILFSQLNLIFRTKTCFYNGMDQYAKEWLNLLHPFYFIIIAILFIVLSRYSAAVQRLTAQRALPVLATLILLSYTKILLSVCNVLFRYARITHLPSNKTELRWVISTTTPLFGPKFLAMFIYCIILFLLLLPFNVMLLFTRKLSRFKVITKLKPLLDTYFSVYKDKAYYWTGLLLLVRVMVYISSVFDKDISLITICILLVGVLCLHGIVQPFKSKFHNIQESVTIVNLLVAHIALLYKRDSIVTVAQIPLMVGLVYFIIAIIFYCCDQKCRKTILKCTRWLHCKREMMHAKAATKMEDVSIRMPEETDSYQEFREPLVEYES